MVNNKEKKVGDFVEEITYLPARSGNKTLYLLTVEDLTGRVKRRVFVSKYLDKTGIGVDFVGYEIASKTVMVKTEDDAIDLANKGNRELLSLLFPWNRVISIRNTSFKEAKHVKNTFKHTIVGE